jgi:hypothetical protein
MEKIDRRYSTHQRKQWNESYQKEIWSKDEIEAILVSEEALYIFSVVRKFEHQKLYTIYAREKF